jgi:DNA-binding MurR/RpiR family transcriptional regulator
MASAAALFGAAERIVFTGSGPGVVVAASGASIFAELGFDAHCRHAGDLTTGSLRFQPGDLVVGVDSECAVVASALRRAHNAGLHTVGMTTRDLTIIDADVLLFVPAQHSAGGLEQTAVLACCLALALLAARLDTGTVLAAEVAKIERNAHSVTSASGRMLANYLFGPMGEMRIVFAGRGASSWVAAAIVQRLNQRAGRQVAPLAAQADLHDIEAGDWIFEPADMLVEIDPYERSTSWPRPPLRSGDALAPHRIWSFTRRPPKTSQVIHLPARSPALGALIAYTALATLLEFAGESSVPST